MILVRTPFRIPLGGGGTDLPAYYERFGGRLITAAVNKYMFININRPAIVDKIRVAYTKVDVVECGDIDGISHGIVREALRWLDYRRPIEISSMADLSAGTGMGSSSAYTVGLWQGLNVMLHRDISKHTLAEEACEIEITRMGKPIGKQDQYASAFGGILSLRIERDGTVAVQPLDLEHETVNEMEHRLLLFYTGLERDANVILGEQSEKVRSADTDATASMHRIKDIGVEIERALLAGDVSAFGSFMDEHWREKKRVSARMSDERIDAWYELARKNGALGGKLMGAGGGGFFLFCCDNGSRRRMRAALEAAGLRYMDFRFDWDGSKVLVNL
jgi:D-glycero-alpha-D-manno-heptose-7-phosphate kinase